MDAHDTCYVPARSTPRNYLVHITQTDRSAGGAPQASPGRRPGYWRKKIGDLEGRPKFIDRNWVVLTGLKILPSRNPWRCPGPRVWRRRPKTQRGFGSPLQVSNVNTCAPRALPWAGLRSRLWRFGENRMQRKRVLPLSRMPKNPAALQKLLPHVVELLIT